MAGDDDGDYYYYYDDDDDDDDTLKINNYYPDLLIYYITSFNISSVHIIVFYHFWLILYIWKSLLLHITVCTATVNIISSIQSAKN